MLRSSKIINNILLKNIFAKSFIHSFIIARLPLGFSNFGLKTNMAKCLRQIFIREISKHGMGDVAMAADPAHNDMS